SELEFGEKDGAITPAMDIFSLGCVIAELFLEGTPIFSLAQLFEYRAGEYDPGVYLEKIEDAEIRAHPRTLATNGTSKAAEPQDSNITTGTVLNTDADDKIERIYYEFDKIAFFLGFYNENVQDTEMVVNNSHSDKVGESSRPIEDDGALIFLSLICATIRNAVYPSSKLHALDMLLAIGQHLEDEFKLDRLVPYLIALLGDEIGLVRANAVKTLAHLTITPSNATIFPEYIMPNLRKFATDPEILVRMTYAQCISTFAETALRFLELTQAKDYLNVADNDAEIEGSYEIANTISFKATYDATLHDLQSIIQEQVTTLLIDTESAVKRALLSNITSLCIFFGRQKANDVLLSHMITYLNDRDWMLRSIIGVGTFVGRQSLEEYILPLMIQSLSGKILHYYYAEEFVVEKVLNSLTSLAELGLFQKMKLWELIAIVSPLIIVIYLPILGTIAFIASAARLLPTTDVWCIAYPIIRPFLQADIAEVTELHILENVKEPIPRPVFDKAVSWAGKSNKSSFWKQAKERKANKSASTTVSGNSSLLKAEDQARLIPTSLREARMNSEGKVPTKPVSSSHQPELVTNSLTPSFSTPVRERHISLAKRPVESPKAAPATSTNTTTVIGTMEMPIPAVSKPDITINGLNGNVGPQIEEIPTRKNLGAFVSSTYEGNDRNVKILLDNLYLESFPEPMPVTKPLVPRPGKAAKGTPVLRTITNWRPEDNGSIHIFRIDYSPAVPAPKYGKPQIVRETCLNGEYAVAMEHYDTDLRTMQIVWKFENPKSHGVITAMVSDKKHRWLLIGTSRGIFTLWDLRFRIQIRSWVHPTKSRISKLLLHPQIGNQKWWVIVAAGKNEVSVWDIEKVECKEVFGVRTGDEKIGGISLDMFKAVEPPGPNDILRSAFTAHESSFSADNSIRAVLYPHECNYMITAGSDRKVRFWDNNRIEDSYVIVGSDPDDTRPTYNHRPLHRLYKIQHTQMGIIVQAIVALNDHCITDLAITEIPHPMLISGDRDGVIKVFL
ncbi:17174_t:CDS:10, partial [Racocetra fulgida]